MNFTELQKAVDAAMNNFLIDVGFRLISPGIWIRRRGHDINIIQLQKQSTAKFFCVNLGIHFDFLPKHGSDDQASSDQIEMPDCELKLRLTEQPSGKDQWWPIADASVGEVADLMSRQGLSVFENYRAEGELALIDATRIERGDLGILASLTKVRACLLLSRLHEELGNRDKCVEAALIGLKVAGMAVGPKKALKGILRHFGHSS